MTSAKRKLNEQEIVLIKELATKMTMKEVGYLFGTSGTTVFRIIHGHTYKTDVNEIYLPYKSEIGSVNIPTKRVCELVKGDIFVWGNVTHFVCDVKDGRVKYRNYEAAASGASRGSFGAKNQMKVEII